MTEPAGQNPAAFGFHCRTCGEWHTDLPALEVPSPKNLLVIPEAERVARCILETDFCMIDEAEFYVRALLQLPIVGFDRSFVWMVWVSLDKADFFRSVEAFDESERSHIGPFVGWLDSSLPFYPEIRALKARVHLQDDFQRPLIELEPTDHALAIEQHRGMPIDRAADIVARLEETWSA